MKNLYDVANDLDILESFLIVIRNALMGQDTETGLVGAQAWEDVFSDLCNKLQDAKETLNAIERSKRA